MAACPRFESNPQSDTTYTSQGTARHRALADAFFDGPGGGEEKALAGLPADEVDQVKWAIDYIRVKAPMSDHPLEVEQRRFFLDADFDEIYGTPDIVCGNVIFDLKWREANYLEQMAAYALMLLQAGHELVYVHVLYAERKRAEVITFDLSKAHEIVFPIIDRVEDPTLPPVACDYCGWCAKQLTCPAVVKTLNKVIEHRDDFNLEQWHSSEIKTAEEMGKALRIARVVSEWCESVEHHAKEMAIKLGMVPTGFSIQHRQGNRFITSLNDAFARSGLPQEAFLGACEIKLSKLAEAYAEANFMKKAPAERELEAKLGDIVQRKASTVTLVTAK